MKTLQKLPVFSSMLNMKLCKQLNSPQKTRERAGVDES